MWRGYAPARQTGPGAVIVVVFVAAGLMFLSGALGLEMLGALLESKGDFGTLAYSLLYTFEELLEFVGIAFFIYSLLSYVSDQKYSLQIMIRD